MEMLMIRIILITVFVILFLILSIPVFLVEWIIGKFNPRLRDISSLRIVQGAFRIVILLSGVKLTVIGEEHIPKDEAVLYIGNHRSYFDIVLTYARCRNLTGYVAKKEMLTILQAVEQVKSGISVMIFPEGTRNKNDSELELLPFHEGSFKIAVKSGCPIIPVSITNSSALFEDHFPFVKAVPVIIEYGAPIYPKDLPREEQKFIGKYVQSLITDTLKKNRTALR